jgi:hypothetical protein
MNSFEGYTLLIGLLAVALEGFGRLKEFFHKIVTRVRD